mmetsp:Transcript_12914/g.31059  ORF Transcript_12914/g.31059 Transcript_12914/m.31059 type:complete len:170 (+) Transcript_12914:55-564(+)
MSESGYRGVPLGSSFEHPLVGDASQQWKWHESYRDSLKNMYRTSYADMIHGREVAVKSDMPSGYGGHTPSLRHDVLFRNTAFDRMRSSLQSDVRRDTLGAFRKQLEGVPSSKNPRGPVVPPPAKPWDCPWAKTTPVNALNHRRVPPTMVDPEMTRNSMYRAASTPPMQD